jgi:hypothetical protein
MRPTLRRLLVGAAAIAAATAVAAPANAAGPKVSMLVPDATVAAGFNTLVSPLLIAGGDIELNNASMTFELSGQLEGVSLAAPDEDLDECTTETSQKLTCTVPYPIDLGQYGSIGDLQAKLNATKAALGESGKLKITFSADGIAPIDSTVAVDVAEAVDLSAGKDSTVTTKPGGSFQAGLQVHNNADTVAHGTAVIFDTDWAFQTTTKYSNCFYDEGFLNACVFDQDLAAGRGYSVSVPYRAGKDTMAPGGAYGEFEWLTGDDYNDFIKFLSSRGLQGPGVAGTGGKLELQALPALKSLAKQSDPNQDNNWQNIDLKVTGKQGVDLAATGASAQATEGQTVSLTVGARNVGPATLDRNRSGEPAAAVVITPPTGTTVAKIPDGCRVSDIQTAPGPKQYLCLTSTIFPVNTSVSWTFQFKVNTASDNAKGSVEVNPKCACDIFSADVNKANNVASIVLNPTGSTGSTGSTGGQGGGGSLPITGPQTAVVGGAGVVLVAGGLVGFMIARRRRTRFEA